MVFRTRAEDLLSSQKLFFINLTLLHPLAEEGKSSSDMDRFNKEGWLLENKNTFVKIPSLLCFTKQSEKDVSGQPNWLQIKRFSSKVYPTNLWLLSKWSFN